MPHLPQPSWPTHPPCCLHIWLPLLPPPSSSIACPICPLHGPPAQLPRPCIAWHPPTASPRLPHSLHVALMAPPHRVTPTGPTLSLMIKHQRFSPLAGAGAVRVNTCPRPTHIFRFPPTAGATPSPSSLSPSVFFPSLGRLATRAPPLQAWTLPPHRKQCSPSARRCPFPHTSLLPDLHTRPPTCRHTLLGSSKESSSSARFTVTVTLQGGAQCRGRLPGAVPVWRSTDPRASAAAAASQAVSAALSVPSRCGLGPCLTPRPLARLRP